VNPTESLDKCLSQAAYVLTAFAEWRNVQWKTFNR
jgi:hypothetical protein